MDAVLRATAIYLSLLLILRLSGKRTLAQITVFDFALLLSFPKRPSRDCSGMTSR